MKLSVQARNNINEAVELAMNGQSLSAGSGSGGSITGTAAQPKFQFWGGTTSVPASCAAAATGTKLSEFTLPADFLANAGSGTKALAGTWAGVGAAAAGAGTLAVYYRIVDSGGVCHEQGLVSVAWALSTAYPLNYQVNNGGLVYRCTTPGTSAPSGGPTGTGGSITDGTAVWTYVDVHDVQVTNLSIASGQPVSVDSKTYTAPNP